LEMFIWADRLIDGKKHSYGEWEASLNNTAPALDMIPKDIVLCDWHYEPRESYPSVPLFLEKGFKVLPCSFRKLDAVEAFIKYSYKIEDPNMVGHMFTTWGKRDTVTKYPPLVEGIKVINKAEFYDVSFQVTPYDKATASIKVNMDAEKEGLEIYYTTDGAVPTINSKRYEQALDLEESAEIKALAFDGEKPAGKVKQKTLVFHKALGKRPQLINPPSEKFKAINKYPLTDGILGSSSFSDGQWLAYETDTLEAIIDFEQANAFSKVSVNSVNSHGSWVYQADKMEAFASSDGENYVKLGEKNGVLSKDKIANLSLEFDKVNYRYLKVLVYPTLIPEGYPGAGNGAWLFVDEIVVE